MREAGIYVARRSRVTRGLQESALFPRAQGAARTGRNTVSKQFPGPAAWMLLISVRIMKLCIFVGVNAGGYAGWVLGEPFGLMMAFVVSSVGSILGVILGWKVARHYLA
jgi:hypothetical protein